MDANWATENLRVIRHLMERTALYRRALAPVTLAVGTLGILAGAGGWAARLDSARSFTGFWMMIATAALGLSLLIVRLQALRAQEPIWSPPTRRVAQGMAPGLFAGLLSSLLIVLPTWREPLHAWWLPGIWLVLLGVAIHGAASFLPPRLRTFAWGLILIGTLFLFLVCDRSHASGMPSLRLAHLAMGTLFGGLHLIVGLWLAATETRPPSP
jgi:hypothetical protein